MELKKFCFINPPTSRPQDDLFFPMASLVLATQLKKQGIPVEILDFDFLLRKFPGLRGDFHEFESYAEARVLASQADVFGISCICSNFPNGLQLAGLIRKLIPEAKIIMGGPQPSSVPKQTLELFPQIDVLAVGEGEKTLIELLEAQWSPSSLQKVKGIHFRIDEKIHATPARPLIEDLDELPIPDFSLLDLKAYLAITPESALIEAGRGCPFRCNFCSTAEMWSREYRAKSPGRIHREMKLLHEEYGLNDFALTHDNFTTSPKYTRRFCEYFIQNNVDGFTWNSSARTDTLKSDDLSRFYKAGCRSLFFGVDSGSERIQKVIEKYLKLEGYRKILSESVNHGIRPISSFIVGFPEESREEIDATILLGFWSKGTGAAKVAFHRLSPLASTKVYHDHVSELQFKGSASDMSITTLYNPEMVDFIRANPDLFSSFFEIPTPQLGDVDLFCFTNFYNVLVDTFGPSMSWLFGKGKKTPFGFFEEWCEHTADRPPAEKFSPAFIFESAGELF